MSHRRQSNMQTTLASWEQLKAAVDNGSSRSTSVATQLRQEKHEQKKVDGRTLRRTGRTEQFNFRVKGGTKQEIESIARENGWLIAETLERAIEALCEKLQAKP